MSAVGGITEAVKWAMLPFTLALLAILLCIGLALLCFGLFIATLAGKVDELFDLGRLSRCLPRRVHRWFRSLLLGNDD